MALPVYNERPRIHSTLLELFEHITGELDRYDWEIVVVDDGSSDHSLDEIVSTATEYALPLLVVAHDGNYGLGHALSTIFGVVRGDVIVTVDADLTYSVDHITKLVTALETTGAAVVVASPYADGGRTFAVPASLELRSRLANRYLAAMTGYCLSTFTGIVRSYDGEFARNLPPLRGGANANVEVLREAWRQRREVAEIPAELNWWGQQYRVSRHMIYSGQAIREAAEVFAEGVRLRRVTRPHRARRRRSTPAGVTDEPLSALPPPTPPAS